MSEQTSDFWEQHEAEMARLEKKYLPESLAEFLQRVKPEISNHAYETKQWYIRQIKQLQFGAGQLDMAMRRCKRTDSTTYQKYEKKQIEMQLLADNLIIDLLSL